MASLVAVQGTAPVATLVEERPLAVSEPQSAEVPEPPEDPPASSSSSHGLPLSAMPALNPQLQG